MKLYAISVLRAERPATVLSAQYDLADFGVKEFIDFVSKTLVERTTPGSRQVVTENEYFVHCHVRTDGLGGVLVCDKEYPRRVAFGAIATVLDDYAQRFPGMLRGSRSGQSQQDAPPTYPELAEHLEKFKDPKSADKIIKVQSELDETKVILNNALQSVLERGERLDDLVQRSNDLSMQSKVFYKTAKKQNQCCQM